MRRLGPCCRWMTCLAALGLAVPASAQTPTTPLPPVTATEATTGATTGAPAVGTQQEAHDESRITDKRLPLQLDGFPNRPKPILELGAPFLGTGRIRKGFKIPGGAVWTPSFLLFGTLRSGVSMLDDSTTQTTQWANRLDLFGNLYLTASERVVIGLRPADETDASGTRRFTGYVSRSPESAASPNGSINHFNFGWQTVNALFMEGDIGELFPFLDLHDRRGLDIGFSVGRQGINFQEGLLINDTIDAVGLTQINFKPGRALNFRATGLFGWNAINRHTPSSQPLLQNSEAENGQLVGLFTELETRKATTQIDAIWVRGDQFRYPCAPVEAGCTRTVAATDGLYGGVGMTGRIVGDRVNVAVRAVGSLPVGSESAVTAASVSDPATRGVLGFAEVSWTPHHSENFNYVNAFVAAGRYRAAALDPSVPGPLARAGVLFAGPGLGNVPGALSAAANDVVGGALGHQMFFSHTRQQLLLEVGGRFSIQECAPTQACDAHGLAGTARYQLAVGRRGVIVLDGFAARDLFRNGGGFRNRVGGRAELVIKF